MPNITPLITHTPDNQPLYSASIPYNTNTGIAYANGWTKLLDASGAFPPVLSSVITVPGLVSGSQIAVTVQLKNRNQQTVTDAQRCPLLAAYATTNAIYVYIDGGGTGTNGGPVNTASYGISWQVV